MWVTKSRILRKLGSLEIKNFTSELPRDFCGNLGGKNAMSTDAMRLWVQPPSRHARLAEPAHQRRIME